MVVRLRIGSKDAGVERWRSGHRILSKLYSVTLHGSLIAYGFWGPALDAPPPKVYQSTIVALEKEHKVIYYDFRKDLPEVDATNASSQETKPTPNNLESKQRIVAAPQEKDGKQLVYLPEPKIRLQEDLKAPNLIALTPPVPAPPPRQFAPPQETKPAPPKAVALPNAPQIARTASEKENAELSALLHKPVAGPPPRQFTPPKENQQAPAPAALPNAPQITERANDKESGELAALLHKPMAAPVRQFTAPKETRKEPAPAVALPNAPQIAEASNDKQSAEVAALLHKSVAGPPPRQFVAPKENKPAPPMTAALPSAPAVAGVTEGREGAEASALLNKPLAGPAPKAFTPPPARGRAGTAASAALPTAPSVQPGGPATANVAIIGLNPANVPQIPVPEGNRPARIVAGTPVPGVTRPELGGGNGKASAPDLSVQGPPATAPATATREPLVPGQAPATGLAHPQMPQVFPTTPHVSVPQWPNTRTLPAAVERHFQNRVVYVTLIPSQSGDDWTLWFGEPTVTPVDNKLLVRPPVLLRSAALPPFPAHRDRGTGSERVVAMIHKDGKLDASTDLTGAGLDRELAAALHEWQFSPATRNGVAFDADAVIDIPVVYGTLNAATLH